MKNKYLSILDKATKIMVTSIIEQFTIQLVKDSKKLFKTNPMLDALILNLDTCENEDDRDRRNYGSISVFHAIVNGKYEYYLQEAYEMEELGLNQAFIDFIESSEMFDDVPGARGQSIRVNRDGSTKIVKTKY